MEPYWRYVRGSVKEPGRRRPAAISDRSAVPRAAAEPDA
jgi:hypothetical protein